MPGLMACGSWCYNKSCYEAYLSARVRLEYEYMCTVLYGDKGFRETKEGQRVDKNY